MCGIAGFWKAGGLESGDREALRRMIEAQRHRGPDGDGEHVDERRGIALGHARLTIIDLYTGSQPLVDPDGGLSMVVNGEFYDYKRLRSTLMATGSKFRTKTDSEIALHLYRKHGLDFVEHLRGEFGFALFDAERERLVLVRDRFGIRPLFFHARDDAIYFGSEVKTVLAHGDVPRRLCRRAALNQLMHTMVPGSSAFEGVRALEPGSMLIVERRGDRLELSDRRYWDLDFPAPDAYDHDADAHVAAVREKLVEAVTLRLEADVPVGCYLSGGIDSCSILGMASGAMQSPVKAFTISFDHDEYDEASIAREMAQSVNADQDMIRVGADELYGDNYVRTVWHAERTFYNTLGVAKWCMSRHVHEARYKTVITGEGSDELFGGYPAFKRDMFLHGMDDAPEDERRELEQALHEANRLFRGAILAEDSIGHPAFDELCGFTPSWIQPWLATLRLARPLLHADVREELDGYDPVAAIAERLDPDRLRGRHPLDQAQYTWSKTMLEGQILNWGGDRVDMANSMESRPAFLDHHVAETAVRVPPRLRIRGTTEKWVLREAVRGVLPEVLYRRQKFAFMAPPAHTDEAKRRGVEQLIERYLNEDALRSAHLFDVAAVERFLADYRNDRDPVSLTRKDTLLNHLLCMQILHRQFIEGDVPRQAS
jgi:asparagine synthase (glutamine-hydrolysing)